MKTMRYLYPARLMAVWLAVVVLLSTAPATTAASSNFTYDTAVIYSVNDDGSTDVTEHYTITNNTLRMYLTQIKLTAPTDKISDLEAAYEADDKDIPATATARTSKQGDVSYKNQQVVLAFPRQLYGLGKQWQFNVHYRAQGLVDNRGAAHTVYVPAIQPTEETQGYTVTVSVPQNFGGAHFTGAHASTTRVEAERDIYSFGRDELTQHSLALNFGDVNQYHLNFNYPLVNTGVLPTTQTVTLPPDLNNQKIYINKLSPAPVRTRLDGDGNVLADYDLQPGQHIIVTTDVTGEVRYREYDINKSGYKKDIPADLVHTYTSPSQYWNTGGKVGAETAKLTDPKAPVINNVKAIYQYVIDKLSYNNDKVKFNIRQGSTKALAHPDNAVCLEYADLLVSMLRSQGIPARMPVGYGYSGSLKQSDSVADSLHAWVEAYVPGIGWMTLDPTWGEKFDDFGHSDLDHIAFSIWGVRDQAPAAVMDGTRDLNYQYEKTQLSYGAPAAVKKLTGSVSVVRYMVVPGIFVERATVTAPGQVPTDGNVVNAARTNWQFGSLAPGQIVTQTRFNLGLPPPIQVNYRIKQDGGTLVLASSQASTAWWPFELLAAIMGVLWMGVWLVLRRLGPRSARS